jgi:predicted ester cyclase
MWLGGMHTVFPDLNATIDDLIADGDRVAVRMTVRGTQKASFLEQFPVEYMAKRDILTV